MRYLDYVNNWTLQELESSKISLIEEKTSGCKIKAIKSGKVIAEFFLTEKTIKYLGLEEVFKKINLWISNIDKKK